MQRLLHIAATLLHVGAWLLPVRAAPVAKTHYQFKNIHPVAFQHVGVAFNAVMTAGIKRDFDIKGLLDMVDTAISYCETIENSTIFKKFANHSSITMQVGHLVSERLSRVTRKKIDLEASLSVARNWSVIATRSTMSPDDVFARKVLSQEWMDNYFSEINGLQHQADQWDVTEDFRRNSSNPTLRKSVSKRELSLNFNKIWDSFLDSVLSIFHQTSLRKIKESIDNLASSVGNTFERFAEYEKNLGYAVSQLQDEESTAFGYWSAIDIITFTLNQVEEELDGYLANMDDIARGKINSFTMSPDQCDQAFNEVSAYAATKGLSPIITSSVQILELTASVFSTRKGISTLIHVPLVRNSSAYDVYEISYWPFLVNGSVFKVQSSSDVIVTRNALYPAADHFLTTKIGFQEKCQIYGARAICTVPSRKTPSCQLQLLMSKPNSCSFVKLQGKGLFPPSLAPGVIVVFFASRTEVMVTCGGDTWTSFLIGLNSFPRKHACVIETPHFRVSGASHHQPQHTFTIDDEKSRIPTYVTKDEVANASKLLADAAPVSFDDFVKSFPDVDNSSFATKWEEQFPPVHSFVSLGLGASSWFATILVIFYCLRNQWCCQDVDELVEELELEQRPVLRSEHQPGGRVLAWNNKPSAPPLS